MKVISGLTHRLSFWIVACLGIAALAYNASDFTVAHVAQYRYPAVNFFGWVCFLLAGLASLLLSVAATDQWLLRRATVKQGPRPRVRQRP